jgi:RNA polymerase sigma factor (sigma-70 family)
MDFENQKIKFQELISQHKGILYKVAKIYCREEVDRQDLIQEIMIQLWHSFEKYDDKYKFST